MIQFPFIWPSEPHDPEKKWLIWPGNADWPDPISTLIYTIKYAKYLIVGINKENDGFPKNAAKINNGTI